MACGLEKIVKEMNVKKTKDQETLEDFPPKYNIAPSANVPIVYRQGDSNQIMLMRWGLVPKYSTSIQDSNAYKMNNAREETITEKNTFKHLVDTKRCILLISGFFEWKTTPKGKQGYFIHCKDTDQLMKVACLYEVNTKIAEEALYSFTVLTTSSNEELSWLHHRMPVILDDEECIRKWLDPLVSYEECQSFVQPFQGSLSWYPVPSIVNSTKTQGPECIMNSKEYEKKSIQKGIGRFFKRSNTSTEQDLPTKHHKVKDESQ